MDGKYVFLLEVWGVFLTYVAIAFTIASVVISVQSQQQDAIALDQAILSKQQAVLSNLLSFLQLCDGPRRDGKDVRIETRFRISGSC